MTVTALSPSGRMILVVTTRSTLRPVTFSTISPRSTKSELEYALEVPGLNANPWAAIRLARTSGASEGAKSEGIPLEWLSSSLIVIRGRAGNSPGSHCCTVS